MMIKIDGEKIMITLVAVFFFLLALGFYGYLQRPKVIYTCKVYRIDSTRDTITYTGRMEPSQPHWSRHYGWRNDFGDETICRYELIKTDTIWD